METPRTQAGRTQPIRLSDVPLKIRRQYGQRLIDAAIDDRDIFLATQLTRAVESPSETVYWLPGQAVEKVMSRWK